jgi:thioredoxin 1
MRLKDYTFLTPLVLIAGLFLLLSGCTPAVAVLPVRVVEYHGPQTNTELVGFVRQQVPAPRQAIVYFYADWCGPCRRFRESLTTKPVADAMQQATLVKINVDNYQELAAEYGIKAIPAFVKLDAQDNVVASISSDKWQEDTPENIAPIMHELVVGHRFDAR